jgi:hypothetical protein
MVQRDGEFDRCQHIDDPVCRRKDQNQSEVGILDLNYGFASTAFMDDEGDEEE